ncbi:hypothetical protein DPMN_167808 [Dreissena polymorpha]|uniref:Uncharacterized protein n=1 Tax=Dreissena polymorpha TaxID=45954 RepID=A0A9D4F0X1_DREPO|nr:hypothetical protein DPMN_167808 [Dreissena polymorpha]
MRTSSDQNWCAPTRILCAPRGLWRVARSTPTTSPARPRTRNCAKTKIRCTRNPNLTQYPPLWPTSSPPRTWNARGPVTRPFPVILCRRNLPSSTARRPRAPPTNSGRCSGTSCPSGHRSPDTSGPRGASSSLASICMTTRIPRSSNLRGRSDLIITAGTTSCTWTKRRRPDTPRRPPTARTSGCGPVRTGASRTALSICTSRPKRRWSLKRTIARSSQENVWRNSSRVATFLNIENSTPIRRCCSLPHTRITTSTKDLRARLPRRFQEHPFPVRFVPSPHTRWSKYLRPRSLSFPPGKFLSQT